MYSKHDKRSQRLLGYLIVSTALTSPTGQVVASNLETVTVTAARSEQSLNELAASVSVVDTQELELISATHINEALTRVPGVWISRGNGQEHLTAIRSPVLTGAGSCGAFAITEEGIPVRATGFCNVNQLFDINTEQAGQIDVLRGPGTVLYGSDAQHGVINVISLAPAPERATRLGLETGANDYSRVKLSHSERQGQHGLRISMNGAHDGGYKDDSEFDQQKLSARHDYESDTFNARTLLSINNLNQETAGYVVGQDAYKDADRKRENPNPEAFRDVQSARLQTQFLRPLGDDAQLLVTPYLRHTHMTFMMHFLPGTPVEENGHQSVGVQSAYFLPLGPSVNLTSGVDAELTRAWLTQSQAQGFSAFPAGRQYDYRVGAAMAAAFASADFAVNQSIHMNAGLHYETLQYDYDNKMRSGNTAEDGSLCINGFTGAVGCRYTRPEDSKDSFANLSANLGLVYKLTDTHTLFARAAHGNRAPQATEMYRLQNGQMQANLDSESIQSVELGLRGQWAQFTYSTTAFHMKKDNVIFQNADRLNLNDGETEHQGLEYELHWQMNTRWDLALTGSLADHHYRSNVSAPGSSDTIATDGNRLVSAPRNMNTLRLGYTHENTRAELEWVAMGRYYTDLENAHDYSGHNLLGLRFKHQLGDNLSLGARVKNLTNTDYAERADFSAFAGERYFIGEPRSLFVSIDYAL
ncbi:TonB-dependent receptor [Simiduia sp. 21SJ11W-1]|uniref:TonB-dependent receptor n=1 Tax=Simiduia sp. 21SJ11W-1 TaxID=2909669 RepID=UPI00209D7157|nr:TonB-dependent receptor [Simiduia sp. 21SJ11W-1]UTA48369.1 TonB-dependent receptor [Simiduia sp. 21SJ11W-1]